MIDLAQNEPETQQRVDVKLDLNIYTNGVAQVCYITIVIEFHSRFGPRDPPPKKLMVSVKIAKKPLPIGCK